MPTQTVSPQTAEDASMIEGHSADQCVGRFAKDVLDFKEELLETISDQEGAAAAAARRRQIDITGVGMLPKIFNLPPIQSVKSNS
jgi:hypothetical protein